MGRWTVDWETWNFDETGKIEAITGLPGFTIEAAFLEEAVKVAEKEARGELRKLRKELPSEFAGASSSVPYIRGLKDEKGDYHKLRNAHGVFGGQIRELDQFGE